MMYSLTSLPEDLMGPSHFTGLDVHLNSLDSKLRPRFLCNEPLKCNLRTTLVKNTLSELMQMHSSDHAMKAYRTNSAITNWFSGETFFYLN